MKNGQTSRRVLDKVVPLNMKICAIHFIMVDFLSCCFDLERMKIPKFLKKVTLGGIVSVNILLKKKVNEFPDTETNAKLPIFFNRSYSPTWDFP